MSDKTNDIALSISSINKRRYCCGAIVAETEHLEYGFYSIKLEKCNHPIEHFNLSYGDFQSLSEILKAIGRDIPGDVAKTGVAGRQR